MKRLFVNENEGFSDQLKLECNLIKRDMNRLDYLSKKNENKIRFHEKVNTSVMSSYLLIKDLDTQIKRHNARKEESAKRKGGKNSLEGGGFKFLKQYSTYKPRWDEKLKHEELLRDVDGYKIESLRYGWKTALVENLERNTKGEYFFKLKLINYAKNQLCLFGLVDPKYYIENGDFKKCIINYGYCLDLSNGNIVRKKRSMKYMKPVPRKGDSIGVHFNLDKKEVGFSLIDKEGIELDYGVAFKNIKNPSSLTLGISCFISGQKFELEKK